MKYDHDSDVEPRVLDPWRSFCPDGSQLGSVLPPRGHLAISGDVCDGQNWETGGVVSSE